MKKKKKLSTYNINTNHLNYLYIIRKYTFFFLKLLYLKKKITYNNLLFYS